MLKGVMHKWERAEHSQDNNRYVRPFKWGVEHLCQQAEGLTPRQTIHQFVDRVLSDSDPFFTPKTPAQFTFKDGQLVFASPIQSPYPENNRVTGRFFPAGSSHRAVIVLPHWNADERAYVALCRLLTLFGFSALRLTLPYHEARKPAHLERSDYIISSNIGLTIQASRQAVLETRLAVDWLEDQGYQQIGIMGTSIGSCIAFLTFAHEERLKAAIFNHASSNFADVVWTGLTTQHVRQGIEPHLRLEELRRFWSVISPQTFIYRLERTERKSLVISAKYDLSFLPSLTQQFHQQLERWEVPFDKAILPCGHYSSGKFPFKYIEGYLIVKFFRKHLVKV